ncbi:hypothetical protein KFL_006500060 [Klebsormidium nitens]|uniref:SbsA Ig-like domain-containing protein n=1 Tax=Klebsormidium nitens TaxID=105231 RepID=A0A1Y1IK63_KLENI|nr:hypothetical protein KFL_006500060 [Klebsormidium nitens]|eukprot:GAQ90512.1 hypothetical protein KFL_006500060 [Klebsormidium nitens]
MARATSSSLLLLSLVFALWDFSPVAGQSTTLTVAGPNSTATPRLAGANALDITFDPPVVQVTGVLTVDVLACGLVPGLPTNAAIGSTSLMTAPPTVTASATARGTNIGSLTISGASLNVSTPTFPINQTDGTYTVAPNSGTVVHVARANGSLTGKPFDESGINIVFQSGGTLPAVQITGTFRPLPPGLLEMTATSTVQVPLNQVVTAVGLGGSELVRNDTAGGSIQLVFSLVATGPDPCLDPECQKC